MPKVCIGLLASCVSSKYRYQIKACKETWVKDAERLGIPVHFMCGSTRHESFPESELDPVENVVSRMIHFDNVGDDYLSATWKQWYGLKYLYAAYYNYDFVFIGGTDNYIECEKLLEELKDLDPNKPLYIGGHTGRQDIGYKLAFHFGGGGLILSRGALAALDILHKTDQYIDEWFAKCKTLKNGDVLSPACDVALAFFSERVNLGFITRSGMYACNWMGKLEGTHCCHIDYPSLITCHFMEGNMYLYHTIKKELKEEWYRNRVTMYYTLAKGTPSLISKHVARLYRLSTECESIIQVRRRPTMSCFPFIRGLCDNKNASHPLITCINYERAPKINVPAPFPEAKMCDPMREVPGIARGLGIRYTDYYTSELNTDDASKITLGEADLVFISNDSVSTLDNLLSSFPTYAKKYVVVHLLSSNESASAIKSYFESKRDVFDEMRCEDNLCILSVKERVPNNRVLP